MMTVFRPYSGSEGLRSDRSAGDRLRHRQKVREAIRANVADIIAEEAILTKTPDRVVKVPIRGIKEYRFAFDEKAPRVAAAGQGEIKEGQVVGAAPGEQSRMPGAGDRPGLDYYETDITIEELIDLMFEDLQLPELERKRLRENLVDHGTKRRGYRRVGVRVQLDKKRTLRSRIKRKVAKRQSDAEAGLEQGRAPFHREDLRYRRRVPDVQPESNAVVICIMDTSGSMDARKKYLARSFFFLLYQFVRTRYRKVDLAFIAHHTRAREVTEEEFFHKGESGGTMISSGYRKALEISRERYHPSLWNVYAFHCSDGENFPEDNREARRSAEELARTCNLFGYGEIKPPVAYHGDSTMLKVFDGLEAKNFHAVEILRKEDIWPCFKALLSHERRDEETAA
jgi:sporulation protein YhbH